MNPIKRLRVKNYLMSALLVICTICFDLEYTPAQSYLDTLVGKFGCFQNPIAAILGDGCLQEKAA